MASAQFELDPGTGTYGSSPQAVSSSGATVNCRLLSIAGVNPSMISWTIVGTNNSGVSSPSISTSGSPDGQIASFTIPSGVNQSYLVRCEVNGGPDVTGEATTAYQGKFYVLNANSRQPMSVGETTESQGTHGVVDILDAINNQTGSGTDATALRGIDLDATSFGTPADNDVISYDAGTGKLILGPSDDDIENQTWADVLSHAALSGGTSPRISAGDRLELGDNQRYIKTGAVDGIAYHAGITGSQTHEFFTGNVARVSLEANQTTFKVNGYKLRWFDAGSSPFDVLTALNGDVTLSADTGDDVTITGTNINLTGTVVLSAGLDLPNNQPIRVERNAGGGVYYNALVINQFDDFVFGQATGVRHAYLEGGTGSVFIRTGGASLLVASPSAVTYHQPLTSSGTTATLATSAGTWMTGTVALTTVVGDLAFGGGTVASAGDGRLANLASIQFRNAANTQNIVGLTVSGTDQVFVGDPNQGGLTALRAPTEVSAVIGATTQLRIFSASMTLQPGGTNRMTLNGTGIGFFGATPVAQQTDFGALTLTTHSGTPNTTLVDVSGSGDDATINDNLHELGVQINAIRTRLRNYGLVA